MKIFPRGDLFTKIGSLTPKRHSARRGSKRPHTTRLSVEALENRTVPTTFMVANLSDSGPGSLRQAILDANANAGADSIQFASGVTGTITLTSDELAITDAVDLQGPGSGVVAVSGNNVFRVFDVSANATISGLTITGGSSSFGGGIFNTGTLAVSSSTLSGNSCANSGGGIMNWGALTVNNSTLSGNSANNGGGIANGGTLTVLSTSFNSNTAFGGGGIANGGTVTVVSSTFSGNSAYGGGGITNGGTLTLDSCNFSGNLGSSGGGGGIYNYGTLTVVNTTLRANSAGGGGGIINWLGGTATVYNCTLCSNSASDGGGIFNYGTLTVDSSTVSGNNSTGDAGGIENRGTLTAQNCTLTGNSAGPVGGAISNSGTMTLDNSTLSGNSVWDIGGLGAGIYTRGTSTLNNTIVAANFAGRPDDINGNLANSSSHNLIGVDTNLSGISNGINGNRIGTAAAPINPMLGALQDNGGPTQTVALLLGSPAINAGDNRLIPAGVTTDQRGIGYARIDTGTVDIGAFELVVNHPPTALVLTPGTNSNNEGATLNLSGSFVDPDPNQVHTLVVNWGDGSPTTTVLVPGNVTTFSGVSHQYRDNPVGQPNGSFSVTATVTDNFGASALGSTSVQLNNVAPAVGAISGLGAGVRGETLAYSAGFGDPGTFDTHTAVVTWGDSNVTAGAVTELNGSGSVAFSHVYTSAGTYTIAVTVTDKDGGSTSVTRQVVISAISSGPWGPIDNALLIGGTTGADTIRVTPQGNAGDVKVLLNGQSLGVYAAGSFSSIVVFGQAGDDDIQLADSITQDAWLCGGDGSDRLKGGRGNNILEGGNGSDTLIAGAGRDLLLGGAGSDQLTAGSSQAILVGGTTDFDANATALAAIMKEWARTDSTYLQRVDHLLGAMSGGLNNGFVLNASTVHDDAAPDALAGGSGLDLFYLSLGDALTGKKSGDRSVFI